MPFSSGRPSVSLQEVLSVTTEATIASHYLGIKAIPCLIQSPLRQDNHPSFGIYSPNGTEVNYIDFSTRESGRIFKLLSKIWNIPYEEVYTRIYKDFSQSNSITPINIVASNIKTKECNTNSIEIEVKIRKWENYDIEYWKSYGISLEWLKYAEVYPISHKIVTKDGQKYIFGADKYAYAYVERKENNITLKIYQPFKK